jgi:hypothetical protein
VQEPTRERCFWMTEEEAMSLLDIAVLSPVELSPAQRAALGKLSEFCRQFLRVDTGTPSSPPLSRLHVADAPALRAA